MFVESRTVDHLAKEFLRLPEPVGRAVMQFARRAEEIRRSDSRGMDFAETEQRVLGAVAATGRMLLKGLVIGSGSIGAANKAHICERLKRSGMRWGTVGGLAVLTFRSLVKSARFDRAWEQIMLARGCNAAANDNRNQDRQVWPLEKPGMSQYQIHTLEPPSI